MSNVRLHMHKIRAFGVGCFHFGYRKSIPFDYSTATYIEEVEAALASLPSLSELEVSFDEAFTSSFVVSESPPVLMDGDYFPRVMRLAIAFTLFIPHRVQAELFPNEPGAMQTTAETFRVTLQDSFHGTSTFVECVDASEDCSPSDAVRLLREYLRREFSKLTTAITFEYLGPSPFHANFYLRPSLTDGHDIFMEETKKRGYNDLVFSYNPIAASDEVLAFLYDELADELGLFYDIQCRAVRLMTLGDSLTSEWLELQSLTEQYPSIYNLRARLRIHSESQAIVSHAYTLQAQLAIQERQVERDVASTYDKGTPTYLDAYVRGRVGKLPTYPVESILKWAEHIEGASFKQAEIAAVVLSAIGGGVVGSVATLLASRGS